MYYKPRPAGSHIRKLTFIHHPHQHTVKLRFKFQKALKLLKGMKEPSKWL